MEIFKKNILKQLMPLKQVYRQIGVSYFRNKEKKV